MNISKANEDYLEAIIMLGAPDRPIRSVEIAKHMDVSKASVNKAIAALKAKGLVKQQYYGDVELTDEGLALGEGVYKRHRYLTAFLNKAIGLSEEAAEEEACLMEHAISDDSFEKWVAYIDKLDIVPPGR